MRRFILIFFCMFYLPAVTHAQIKTVIKQPLMFSPLYECMRSTHGNLFRSASFTVSKMLNKKYEAGFGIETAYTPMHHDNGFVLYKLKFIPLFGNLKYHFKQAGRFDIYAESSVGLSFNNYQIASEASRDIKTHIREKGVFTYIGAGVKYPVSKNINLVTGIGLKGYKMSFNVLDINPHGVSGLVGLNIKII